MIAHPSRHDVIDDRIDLHSGDRPSAKIERFEHFTAAPGAEYQNFRIYLTDIGDSGGAIIRTCERATYAATEITNPCPGCASVDHDAESSIRPPILGRCR